MRHWIIGNGHSLNDTPLELLEGEVTWGLNRIHLHYPKTSWRPSYYLMVDHNTRNEKGYWKECIRANWETPKFLWWAFRDGLPENHVNHEDLPDGVGEAPNTTWIKRCQKHHYYMADNFVRRAENWHFPDVCTAFSGLFAAMQFACIEGATEIYLLGCDLYGADYEQNFMVNNYTNDMRDRSELDNANMIQGHRVAQRSSPAKIFNATIGGNLEIHPRVNMLEVLNG